MTVRPIVAPDRSLLILMSRSPYCRVSPPQDVHQDAVLRFLRDPQPHRARALSRGSSQPRPPEPLCSEEEVCINKTNGASCCCTLVVVFRCPRLSSSVRRRVLVNNWMFHIQCVRLWYKYRVRWGLYEVITSWLRVLPVQRRTACCLSESGARSQRQRTATQRARRWSPRRPST